MANALRLLDDLVSENALWMPEAFYQPFYSPEVEERRRAGQAIASASPMDLRASGFTPTMGAEEMANLGETIQSFVPRPGIDEWEAFQTAADIEQPGWMRGLAGAGLLGAVIPPLYGLSRLARRFPATATGMRQPQNVNQRFMDQYFPVRSQDRAPETPPTAAPETPFELYQPLETQYPTVSTWEPNPGRFSMEEAEQAGMSLGNLNQKIREYAPDVLYNNPQYQQDILSATTGPAGEDLFLSAMGFGDNPLQQGPGVWKGDVTRGGQSLLMQPDMGQLEAAEGLRGALLGQRGMGQYTPRDVPLGEANILRYETGRELTPYDAGLVDDVLQRRFGDEAGVVPVPGGYDIRSFGDIPPENLLAAGRELQPSNLMRPMAADYGTTSRYVDLESGWRDPEAGRVFGQALNMLDESGLATQVDDPALRRVAGRWLSALRQTGVEQAGIRRALGALTTEGLVGLRRLVAEGKLPAAILVPFGIDEAQNGE